MQMDPNTDALKTQSTTVFCSVTSITARQHDYAGECLSVFEAGNKLNSLTLNICSEEELLMSATAV